MKKLLHLDHEKLVAMQVVDWGYTEEIKARSYNEFREWLKKGFHGNLTYLADHRADKRSDLKHLYADCESALVFLFDYTQTKKNMQEQADAKIAAYTMGFDGVDYHHWVKDKLKQIGADLVAKTEDLSFEISLDVHPVLERDLAFRSGLGWFGKNAMLISREHGSYFILGSLLLSKKLDVDARGIERNHCGTCTRCIDACPTSAIVDNKIVDANKCISTFTIEEFKEVKAPKGYPTESLEIFGCDICQEVCPWNNKPLEALSFQQEEHPFISFFNRPVQDIFDELNSMSLNQFKKKFRGTSFERSGKRGLLKNLKAYLAKT